MDFIEFQRGALVQLGLHQDGWLMSELPEMPEDIVDRARALVDRKQRPGQPWGWKDPRTVLFLRLWSRLVPGATFAIVYRAPWEVIESLYRRGDPILTDHPELAVELWHWYNKALLQLAIDAPDRVVLASVETIAADPAAWVATITDRSGIPLAAPAIEIYEPALLHGDEARDRASLIVRHCPEVTELFAALERRALRPAGLRVTDPVMQEPTAESERLRALHDWHGLSGALRERERTRNDMRNLQAAIDRGEVVAADAAKIVSKVLTRLSGPIGRDLWTP